MGLGWTSTSTFIMVVQRPEESDDVRRHVVVNDFNLCSSSSSCYLSTKLVAKTVPPTLAKSHTTRSCVWARWSVNPPPALTTETKRFFACRYGASAYMFTGIHRVWMALHPDCQLTSRKEKERQTESAHAGSVDDVLVPAFEWLRILDNGYFILCEL